ncbi:MAG: hypothetical protein IJ197_02675 [Bacteroidaceae bacterium]|nr:hypothetical protein [Bacteroidaceae bacterium]
MKRMMMFFIFPFLMTSHAMGQTDYHPFIEEGKIWYVGHYPYGDCSKEPFGMSRYYFEGDTVVADVPCKRWMKDGKLLAPLFEKNRKVYFFRAGEDEPQLLYDFNVSAGERTEVTDFTSSAGQKVICYVCEEKGGSLRNLLLYDSIGLKEVESLKEDIGDSDEFEHMLREDFSYAWTEGIGVMDSPEENVGHGGKTGNTSCLVRVTIGDNTFYDNPHAVWTDGVDEIVNSKWSDKSLYDLSGRRVSDGQRGVRIQGGKKFLVPLR